VAGSQASVNEQRQLHTHAGYMHNTTVQRDMMHGSLKVFFDRSSTSSEAMLVKLAR